MSYVQLQVMLSCHPQAATGIAFLRWEYAFSLCDLCEKLQGIRLCCYIGEDRYRAR
jgi:hypothetical protein